MAQSKEAQDSGRGLMWTHQKTLALIRVWSDTEIQEESEKCKRNKTAYEKFAKTTERVWLGKNCHSVSQIDGGYSRESFSCSEVNGFSDSKI